MRGITACRCHRNRPGGILHAETDGQNEPNMQPVMELDVTVTCSAGTYIRALGRDLGSELGLGGHLTMLRRIRVGRSRWTCRTS